jgi:hypothetical protein
MLLFESLFFLKKILLFLNLFFISYLNRSVFFILFFLSFIFLKNVYVNIFVFVIIYTLFLTKFFLKKLPFIHYLFLFMCFILLIFSSCTTINIIGMSIFKNNYLNTALSIDFYILNAKIFFSLSSFFFNHFYFLKNNLIDGFLIDESDFLKVNTLILKSFSFSL